MYFCLSVYVCACVHVYVSVCVHMLHSHIEVRGQTLMPFFSFHLVGDVVSYHLPFQMPGWQAHYYQKNLSLSNLIKVYFFHFYLGLKIKTLAPHICTVSAFQLNLIFSGWNSQLQYFSVLFFFYCVCQISLNHLFPIFVYSFCLYNIISVKFSFILHAKFHWTVFIPFYCTAFVSFVNINFNKV